MNLKELLLVVLLALGTTWLIDYFLLRKSTSDDATIKSGQSFVAPKVQQELKPLNTEVDFVDTDRSVPATITDIKTAYAHLKFSTDGASLISYQMLNADRQHPITTLNATPNIDRENACFLVALDNQTPFYYTLVDQQKTDDATTLTYQAQSPAGTIRKIFTVHHHTCRIDLSLTVTPTHENQVRILYAAPRIAQLDDDVTSAVLNDASGNVVFIPRKNINTNMYWVSPTFFGADDRYALHTLYADQNKFVQRAYYKLTGHTDITAILEGPTITQETSWQLSLYCGPKQEHALAAVGDPRLLQTVGYAGWLAPIARWLLKLLNFLFSYLGNYGLAIIALTILTKLLLLPFALKGARSMKHQQEVQRKLKYLQQRYKDDPQTLAYERAELMRKEGLSSMAGCLPLLLQLPIFFALSRVLSTSVELYQAPFLWIHDLSSADPYYILPILTGASMLIQALTVDPNQRVQLMVMALIFGAITASLASGLVLYIVMSTLLGILQTVVQKRFNWA